MRVRLPDTLAFLPAVLLLLWSFWDTAPAAAQELNCSVSINYSQLDGSQYTYLDNLERRVQRFLNERSWTEDTFQPFERIDCSFQILMQEAVSLTEFRARLTVASTRPIYNTAQRTPVLRVSDTQWTFEYTRGTPLIDTPGQYDPITSILSFYAYIVLGYDYDTFSALGGTRFFEKARDIGEEARSAGASGWSSLAGAQSRMELIDELLSARFEPLRQALFRYHLQGLDRFVTDTQQARTDILNALRAIEQVSQQTSRAYALDLFFAAKYDELTAVFRDSGLAQSAYGILTQIDPAHTSTYSALVGG
ncbi:type IX secretion system protein PorD [Salisaeta longa]|uniref:type IX secretion system protein PorD n=1 Tax=Salisaeta longa TaxID=503170 RepID=UPI0003B4CA4F|nr:DUF4835 family protein [Salisaeta longa]